MSDIHVRIADWQKDHAALRSIRETVFIAEQAVPPELEWDADDASAVHFLALAGEYPIGTARLLPDGHIGRVSVLKDWRGLKVGDAPGRTLEFEVLRDGRALRFQVTPSAVDDNGRSVGRIGAALADAEDQREQMFVTVRYGLGEALSKGIGQTWDTAAMSVSVMGRMIVGEVSVKNLSGPVTIADFAGQSARMGWAHYIKFLALISISLGVLNLMPVPVLDGGHLLYYVIEIIKGGPVSERAMEIGQQIGMALLAALMAFAFYNDINRLVAS